MTSFFFFFLDLCRRRVSRWPASWALFTDLSCSLPVWSAAMFAHVQQNTGKTLAKHVPSSCCCCVVVVVVVVNADKYCFVCSLPHLPYYVCLVTIFFYLLFSKVWRAFVVRKTLIAETVIRLCTSAAKQVYLKMATGTVTRRNVLTGCCP